MRRRLGMAGSGMARHGCADTTLVAIEASDAIDAVAGLIELAVVNRRRASSRIYAGPRWKGSRAAWRDAAKVYEAAAIRVQRAVFAESMATKVGLPQRSDA